MGTCSLSLQLDFHMSAWCYYKPSWQLQDDIFSLHSDSKSNLQSLDMLQRAATSWKCKHWLGVEGVALNCIVPPYHPVSSFNTGNILTLYLEPQYFIPLKTTPLALEHQNWQAMDLKSSFLRYDQKLRRWGYVQVVDKNFMGTFKCELLRAWQQLWELRETIESRTSSCIEPKVFSVAWSSSQSCNWYSPLLDSKWVCSMWCNVYGPPGRGKSLCKIYIVCLKTCT